MDEKIKLNKVNNFLLGYNNFQNPACYQYFMVTVVH